MLKTKGLLNSAPRKQKTPADMLALQSKRRIITQEGVYHSAIFCQAKTVS
jgi:hypothetical protein